MILDSHSPEVLFRCELTMVSIPGLLISLLCTIGISGMYSRIEPSVLADVVPKGRQRRRAAHYDSSK